MEPVKVAAVQAAYHTLLHFAPDGTLAARHRKLMPTGGERLVWGMGDGSTLQVVDTGFGRLGGLICWENHMPLARFHLYAQGIDVWLAPTLAPGDGWIATMGRSLPPARHLPAERRHLTPPRGNRAQALRSP